MKLSAKHNALRFPETRPRDGSSSKLPPSKIVAEVLSHIGGVETLMDYARLSRDRRISGLAREWREGNDRGISGDAHTSLEKVCKSHGVEPLDLLREVALAAIEFNAYAATLITAQALPNAVKACARRARKADGAEDRRMLFQHTGFLPSRGVPMGRMENSVPSVVAGRPSKSYALPRYEDGVIATSRALRGETDWNRFPPG